MFSIITLIDYFVSAQWKSRIDVVFHFIFWGFESVHEIQFSNLKRERKIFEWMIKNAPEQGPHLNGFFPLTIWSLKLVFFSQLQLHNSHSDGLLPSCFNHTLKKQHTPYNIPLLKNSYFLSNLHETWSK